MADLICPNCSSSNPPDNLFCQSCGFSLKGVKPASGEKTVMAPRAGTPPPVLPEKKGVVLPPPPSAAREKPALPVAKPAAAPPPPPAVPIASAVTPPTAAPPAPPPALPPAPAVYYGTPIRKLGFTADSWYELVPGEGSRAEELAMLFKAEVEATAPKGVRVVDSLLNGGGFTPRTYHLITNGTGATVAARFSTLGKDLYAGWELLVRREINWIPLVVIGGVAFIMGVMSSILSCLNSNFFYGLLSFFQIFLGLLLAPGFALLLIGKLLKDDLWGFFFKDQDAFMLDDANALSLLVDDALSRAIEKMISSPQKKK